MTFSPPQLKPIHADGVEDAWDKVNPADCYRFMGGYVLLNKYGYWFPYDYGYSIPLVVNVIKPHVLI